MPQNIANRKLEYSVLVCLVVIGLLLRIWHLGSLGLNHFDEGAYAISGLWSVTNPPIVYNNQILISPPLYPVLIGIAYFIQGHATDTVAILINVFVGTISIILVWRIARRWFGSSAGIAAAALTAFCEFLITYSRMALTDVVFGFFFLLSLAAISLAYEKATVSWAVIAGLSIGAAWNTKYHGWFLIVIAWSAILLMVIFRDLRGREMIKGISRALIITGVACLCFIPWVLYAQSQPGGFLGLLQYQRTFINLSWLDNLARQLQNQLFIDGWLSRAAPALAFLLVIFLNQKTNRFDWRVVGSISLALFALGSLLGGVILSSLLCLYAIFGLIKSRRYADFVFLSALGLLFFTTPLYKPYPRLLLPWILCVFVISGHVIGNSLRTLSDRSVLENNRKRGLSIGIALVIGLASIGLMIILGPRPVPQTWMATDVVRNAAEDIQSRVQKNDLIYVYGVPELAFYLIQNGYNTAPIDLPMTNPDVKKKYPGLGQRLFLVTGIYPERRDPKGRNSLMRLKDRLQKIATYPMQPNDERILNDFNPKDARDYRLQPGDDYNIYLYRVLSVPGSS